MPPGPTPRQLARAENTTRIKTLALAQLAASGAATLSLRAIARELHIVSSAIYRYYPSRDDLITDLVLDAYSDLADTLEAAGRPRRSPRRRWVDTGHALRTWARAEPHRFALVYGSAIPGYRAPASTVAPAGRVVAAFLGLAPHSSTRPRARAISRALGVDLDRTGAAFGLDVDREVVLAHTAAFAQLVGLLTLELNGHLVGGFEPADELFDAVLERTADGLGLPAAGQGAAAPSSE